MRQNILTVLSVGFLFLMHGLMGLSLLTCYSMLEFWKQKLMIIVELNDQVEENSLNKLQYQLENAAYTAPNSLNIITKDEAAELMKKDFGEDFLSADLPNPLHHVYTFNVTKDYCDTLALEAIREELKQNEAVYDVFYEANLSQKVSKNGTNFLWYAAGLSILFIFVAVFSVRQSVLIQIQSAKSILKDETERWHLPTMTSFLVRNAKNSLWSGAIAVSGVIIVNYKLNEQISEIAAFVQNTQLVLFLVILFLITVITYILSTWLTYLAILKRLKI
ncbi:MAG: cell division protein FtsX [Saprospiraceae bacterium]